MIQEFIKAYFSSKEELKKKFSEKHPENYYDFVKEVVTILNPNNLWDLPDPSHIHEIDDGEYQGTLLYLIAAYGYQPYDYWYVRIAYGSCSGRDTLQEIRELSDELSPTPQQVEDYMTLALHIIQGLKKLK